MSRARAKGTTFESLLRDGFAAHLGAEVHRSPLTGSRDIGDLIPLHTPNGRLVVEAKNHQQLALSEWVAEAQQEARNANAAAGVVIHKRRGRGGFLDQYVTMTVADLLAIVWGTREHGVSTQRTSSTEATYLNG